MNRGLPILLVTLLLLSACGRADDSPQPYRAHLHGSILVDAGLDTLGDYSGFELIISSTSRQGLITDTLFHSVTGPDGSYEGEVRFFTPGLYTMLVSRRGEELAYSDLVLAQGDTIRFDAEFPDVERTATIHSRENDLFRSYLRLQTGINRIFRFAEAGHISADTLQMEVEKWSDLFWEFYEENPGTFAGRQSAAASIRLLEGWREDEMLERLNRAVRSDNSFVPLASQIGVWHYAGREGFEAAVAYIDTLLGREPGERIEMQLSMDRVKLYYDSARVDQARLELNRFRDLYGGNEIADDWIERFEFDLTKLAPGSELPDFRVTADDGTELSRSALRGRPYILEFTRLDNALYQEQFDRNIAIHHIYKNYGVDFVTIPFGASRVMMDAFFEERVRLWPFAAPESVDAEELVEQFNINVLPTRILVDRSGRVVRKYEGTEYNDIIHGLRTILNETGVEEPS